MSRYIAPMKAKTESKMEGLWVSDSWMAEEKLDGSRYLLHIEPEECHLISRRLSVTGADIDKAGNVPHITKRSVWLDYGGTILDGEVVGPSDFGSVISVMGSSPHKACMKQDATGWCRYVVFDILRYKGTDMTNEPFYKRRELVEEVVDAVKHNHVIAVKQELLYKKKFYEDIVKKGGEGVVLKNLFSKYSKGGHKGWVKVKKVQTYDGIVVGGNPGGGKYANTLGALIIAQYRNDRLVEVATIGGMTDELRTRFWERLQTPALRRPWVVEFEAQEKTKERYRHPRFLRVRDDKNEIDCKW